jgi:PPOX class probable F420-dependent enzyme
MIGNDESFDRFVSDHRWAVLTTLRDTTTGSEPVSSVIAYARDGDELVISTPGGTFKRRSIERNPRVNLCVISNAEPFNFVAIEGEARVQHENLLEDTRRVFANIRDVGYEEPQDLQGWLESQQRVILRITPRRVHGVIR